MTMRDHVSGDTIHVYLRDCMVPLFVGVYDHEKPKPQPVMISIEVSSPLSQRYDNLEASDVGLIIDYAQLHEFVTVVLPDYGHISLLETVAERIITFCFQDARIESVEVRLEKPMALNDKTIPGIKMRRQRKLS